MSATMQLNRRDFIKTVSAAGAGLALAFYLPGDETANAAPLLVGEDFSPNAFLRIAADGSVLITVAKVEMGQGVKTALPMIVAEELDADWSNVTVEQSDAHPTKYGSQGTGGSFSIRGSWQMLRSAGATARAMLVQAAARTWNVDPSSCKTENGWVTHPSGKKASYGELAAQAAELPVPTSVPLKDAHDFRILGKSTHRVDTASKSNGSAVFGIDVRVPGMLFASIERPPVFGGKVKSFDASKAKSVAGVRDVVQVESGIAVVANSTWAAFRGREALTVEWDEGEYASQNSAAIRTLFADAVKERGTVEDYDGEAEAVFASAPTKIEAVYEAPLVAHVTMEPMNCTAHVQKGRCEIWAPTQSPQAVQSEAARILGLPLDRVTVHITQVGGGFGRRLETDYAQDAVHVAKLAGAPVQVVWKREDDMQHDHYRPSSYNVLKGGLDAAGNPVTWLHRVAGPSSHGLVVSGSTPPYNIPNFSIDSHIKETGVPIGPWRSVGPSLSTFIVESFIDELAHAAKKDPFEFRRGLLTKSPRLKRTLEAAAQHSSWRTPLPGGMGRGIACIEGFGSTLAHVAEVSVDKDGSFRIHRIVCAIDCGPVVNPDGVAAQIEGAVAFGLSAVMKDEITIDKGRVVQSNFNDYSILSLPEMPKVEVHIIPSNESIGGLGETGVPAIAPALCNALFAATGKRIRRLPIKPEDLKKA